MRYLSARAFVPAFTIAIAMAIAMTIMLPYAPAHAAANSKNSQLIEFERMTWPEVKAALATGKTTALIYTGGIEQRGPQNANGGHNQMAYATVKAIAEKLGNAIFMPVVYVLDARAMSWKHRDRHRAFNRMPTANYATSSFNPARRRAIFATIDQSLPLKP